MQGDHAPKYVRNQHVVMEASPERWKVILGVPIAVLIVFVAVYLLFSIDLLWSWNFPKQ